MISRYLVGFEKNRIKIVRDFEKDLPETIVPDEQLRFILDSVLQFAITSMNPVFLITDGSPLPRPLSTKQCAPGGPLIRSRYG
jgi:hypothetical protein